VEVTPRAKISDFRNGGGLWFYVPPEDSIDTVNIASRRPQALPALQVYFLAAALSIATIGIGPIVLATFATRSYDCRRSECS
jgi:hypothetical protein